MNKIETQIVSNGSHVDDTMSNGANVEEISEREMRLHLAAISMVDRVTIRLSSAKSKSN